MVYSTYEWCEHKCCDLRSNTLHMKNEAFSRAYTLNMWLLKQLRHGPGSFSLVDCFNLMWQNRDAFHRNRNKISNYGSWLLECAITSCITKSDWLGKSVCDRNMDITPPENIHVRITKHFKYSHPKRGVMHSNLIYIQCNQPKPKLCKMAYMSIHGLWTIKLSLYMTS